MNGKKTLGVVAAVACLGMAGQAMAVASTLTVDYQGTGGGVSGFTVSNNYTTKSGLFAGRLKYKVVSNDSGNSYLNAGTTYHTFCTELTDTVADGSADYFNNNEDTDHQIGDLPTDTAVLMGDDKAAAASDLFSKYYSLAIGGTNVQRAAFQLALWEIVYEDGFGVDGSDNVTGVGLGGGTNTVTFSANSNRQDAYDLANTWLSGLSVADGVSDLLVGFGSSDMQDQLILIPLPAPALMAAVGLAGVIVARRRNRA